MLVSRQLDDELRDDLLQALISAHQHPDGREALLKLGIDRFVAAPAGLYDHAREFLAVLPGQKER